MRPCCLAHIFAFFKVHVNADGTVHYSADEILEDSGTVTLLIRTPDPYRPSFDVDCMRRYLASLPWPKRARGSVAGGE